jgi:hypothetical protein
MPVDRHAQSHRGRPKGYCNQQRACLGAGDLDAILQRIRCLAYFVAADGTMQAPDLGSRPIGRVHSVPANRQACSDVCLPVAKGVR